MSKAHLRLRAVQVKEELDRLEADLTEELAAMIGDFVDGKESSSIKDVQPPESIIQAMAVAATQVLMAFERGYRMSGDQP